MRRSRAYGSTRVDDIAWARGVREAALRIPEQEGPPIPKHIEDERRQAYCGPDLPELWELL